jgi:hypothetical protein
MEYNDALTGTLLDICERCHTNTKWFWLVHVFGTVEHGFMCLLESGERYNYKEFTQRTFAEVAEAFAKDIPEAY